MILKTCYTTVQRAKRMAEKRQGFLQKENLSTPLHFGLNGHTYGPYVVTDEAEKRITVL
jgi:hypothetical protein